MPYNKESTSLSPNIFVFKTDIASVQNVEVLSILFNTSTTINNWNVDTQDIDNVLRIETKDNLKENDIIKMVKGAGFSCEVLTY